MIKNITKTTFLGYRAVHIIDKLSIVSSFRFPSLPDIINWYCYWYKSLFSEKLLISMHDSICGTYNNSNYKRLGILPYLRSYVIARNAKLLDIAGRIHFYLLTVIHDCAQFIGIMHRLPVIERHVKNWTPLNR